MAWREFLYGKRGKPDVQEFQMRLMDNIFALRDELVNKTYKHGGYKHFRISDPKPRDIHKAGVRDRLLHHAVYRILYPLFDKTFITDSYSCRLGKGTHRALNKFRAFAYKVSQNNTKTCWVLKCDIRKFFASIDHEVLARILEKYIKDEDTIWLLQKVIESFSSTRPGVGLPLGNLTSQLLVNIYMNEFDQFMKHGSTNFDSELDSRSLPQARAKYYIRYADDFVILSDSRKWLEHLIPIIQKFLFEKLKLNLHPNKISIKTLASGVDYLGWVHFPDHRVLRTSTKRRMLKRIKTLPSPETMNSYLGLLKHGNTRKIRKSSFQWFV